MTNILFNVSKKGSSDNFSKLCRLLNEGIDVKGGSLFWHDKHRINYFKHLVN